MAATAKAMVLSVANRLQKDYLARYNEYLEECAEDAKNGHRAHYCEHGANQWTDYDNICGYCEEGFTMADGVMRREFALKEAHERVSQYRDLLGVLRELNRLRVTVPEQKNAILAKIEQVLLIGY